MAHRVFVLNESKVQRSYYQAILEDFGFQVDAVNSLEGVLSSSEKNTPELLVVSGTEKHGLAEAALKFLRARTETLLMPVVAICSSYCAESRERLLDAGAVDVIDSECSEEFLCQRVSDILENKQTLSVGIRRDLERYRVLVVEDNHSIQLLYKSILSTLNCDVMLADDGMDAWKIVREHGQEIDLIITDIFMPRMNGKEFCMLVKNNVLYDSIPIIVVTTDTQEDTLVTLLNAGVTDYITKPFGQAQLRARMKAHLRGCYFRREQQRVNNELWRLSASLEQKVRERTDQLHQANIDTIYKLAIACDYKDANTANHISRVRYYVKELALQVGCDKSLAEELSYSSMMHDVGKLGIPDDILKKTGPLSASEWQVMKSHSTRGAELLGDNSFFRHARDIALYHHEKFDGSGYPEGISGQQIPLSARIVAVVDIFDALTSARSYKDAWDIDKALNELEELKGTHLDPAISDAMIEIVEAGKTDYIREQWPCAEPVYRSV